MKKLFLIFISCLTILLYIPFNTFAEFFTGDPSQINNITESQKTKILELYNSHSNENLVIFYNYSYNYLYWSYDITSYNTSSKDITLNNIFCLKPDNSIITIKNETTYNIDFDLYFIYLYYNGNIIFENPNLLTNASNYNTLLFSTSYENVVRTRITRAAASNRTRFLSYVDYDIRYTIKGANFDVYYLVNNEYKLIQSSINTFTIYNHESKYNFKDSSIENDYPDYPSIPNNTIKTYTNEFKHNNFLFKIRDLNSQNLIVKAPDTDSLISDGNSNSQSTTNQNNDSNQLLDNTVNQMESLENGFKNDLNNNLNNINSNDFNISNITQLSNAANFVRVQFDNLTKNNPFGTILGFSLFLGLSLLIIGKRL